MNIRNETLSDYNPIGAFLGQIPFRGLEKNAHSNFRITQKKRISST